MCVTLDSFRRSSFFTCFKIYRQLKVVKEEAGANWLTSLFFCAGVNVEDEEFK